jgi:glycosidase
VEKPGNFETWDSAPTVNGFKGGDLLGVAEKLDYLEDLGVNAIYFNPIFNLPAITVTTRTITSRSTRF